MGCTMIIPDLATIPVWLRLLCRLINFCVCCPVVLYFWNERATVPLLCRFLCGFIIVAYFSISAAKLIFDLLCFEPDGATADDTVVRLTIIGVLLAMACIFPTCSTSAATACQVWKKRRHIDFHAGVSAVQHVLNNHRPRQGAGWHVMMCAVREVAN